MAKSREKIMAYMVVWNSHWCEAFWGDPRAKPRGPLGPLWTISHYYGKSMVIPYKQGLGVLQMVSELGSRLSRLSQNLPLWVHVSPNGACGICNSRWSLR